MQVSTGVTVNCRRPNGRLCESLCPGPLVTFAVPDSDRITRRTINLALLDSNDVV